MDSKRTKKSTTGSQKRKRSDEQRVVDEGEPALKKRKVGDSNDAETGEKDEGQEEPIQILQNLEETLRKILLDHKGQRFTVKNLFTNFEESLSQCFNKNTLKKSRLSLTSGCLKNMEERSEDIQRDMKPGSRAFEYYFLPIPQTKIPRRRRRRKNTTPIIIDLTVENEEERVNRVVPDDDHDFVDFNEEEEELLQNLEETLRKILSDHKGRRFTVNDFESFEVSKCFQRGTQKRYKLSKIRACLKNMEEESEYIHRDTKPKSRAYEYFFSPPPPSRRRRTNSSPIIVDLTIKEEEEVNNIPPPPPPPLVPPPPPQRQASQKSEERVFKNGIFVECKIMNSVFSKTCKFVEVPQKGSNSFKKCSFSNIVFKDCVFCNCEVMNCQFQF